MNAALSTPTLANVGIVRRGQFQARSSRACCRTVVRASANHDKAGPAQAALKALGALTAIQLAISPIAGPALADSSEGTPSVNLTSGAETGSTRANYAGLGDIKGPNKPKDSFASGQLDLPDTLGGDSVKAAADAAGEKISGNAKQLSKASDVLTGPGGANDAK